MRSRANTGQGRGGQRSLIWRAPRTAEPARAPARRAAQAPASDLAAPPRPATVGHPLTATAGSDNERLWGYERRVRDGFARIVPTLKAISALEHDPDFEARAQAKAREVLGFELPGQVLADAWVAGLDMRALYAWCVFQTFHQRGQCFFREDPLAGQDDGAFVRFLQECGFHALDLSPCADGRLAHLVSYVLRLPYGEVRRKSYAGALFDVEESVQRWQETELRRFREGLPNTADAPTRYLKLAAYHFSSSAPETQGCAAHGSDERQAAEAALDRLTAFRTAIENSHCCGASIDLLMIGVDTDTDAARVHLPDTRGDMSVDRYLDVGSLYEVTHGLGAAAAHKAIDERIAELAAGGDPPDPGMQRLVALLVRNNLAQIDYVRSYYGGRYADVGHREWIIGVGNGLQEVQLRNLTYFAYMDTVEEGAADLDVGIKVFKSLNLTHSLPIPVIVRFEYRGAVPGARARAEARCQRVSEAIQARYSDLVRQGMLHTMLTVRDCQGGGPAEVVGGSLPGLVEAAA